MLTSTDLRRTRRGLIVAGSGAFAAFSLALFAMLRPPRHAKAGVVRVAAANVPANGANPLEVVAGKFFLVRSSGEPLALDWACTFQGCRVLWVPADGWFNCPCCGAHYDLTGLRLRGPSPRPLDEFAVTVRSDGSFEVDTTRRIQRVG